MATAAMALLINGTASVPDPQATNGTLSMPTATPAVVPPTTVAPPLVSVPIQDICDTIPNLPICSLSRQCSVAPVCQAYASYPNLCNDPGVWYFFLPTCREAQLPDVQYAEPLNILNTTYILDRSNSICSEMPNMAGCSMCTFPVGAKPASACDLASVYGSLCRDMPDMKQCDGWVTFCDSYADSHRAICGDHAMENNNCYLIAPRLKNTINIVVLRFNIAQLLHNTIIADLRCTS